MHNEMETNENQLRNISETKTVAQTALTSFEKILAMKGKKKEKLTVFLKCTVIMP